MPRNNLSSSQKSSADKKVKVAGPSNQHCHSSYITQPYEWIWIKNKHTVLDAPPASTCFHLCPPTSTCIHFHPHASTFLHLHPPASTCIHLHPPLSFFVQLRLPMSTCVHLGQPAFTCVHLRPSAFTCIHLRISASTFIHLHSHVSTSIPCIQLHPLLSTCVWLSDHLVISTLFFLATFANFCQCLETVSYTHLTLPTILRV